MQLPGISAAHSFPAQPLLPENTELEVLVVVVEDIDRELYSSSFFLFQYSVQVLQYYATHGSLAI